MSAHVMALPIDQDRKALIAQIDSLEGSISPESSQEHALESAIRAAELCMRALKLATDKQEKALLSSRCKSLLNQAENIKLRSNHDKPAAPSPPSAQAVSAEGPPDLPQASVKAPKKLSEPSSTRTQSKAEQIIVLKASKLNGSTFQPWKDAPGPGYFQNAGSSMFEDSVDLGLSEQQSQLLAGWYRPEQALPPPAWPAAQDSHNGPTMTVASTVDLVQDAATDCSVVASLCSGTARGERGHARVLSTVMHPYDHQRAEPAISANGKYVLRMNFNGCYRRVTIDDRLPVSKSQHMLHVIDRSNPSLLWPALVEKAYLKVRGGYGFPGSNPSTDLWTIIGWIPEHVFMQDDTLNSEVLWKRLFKAHNYGDVLVNLGTGPMSRRVERSTGLASQHAYAVLDLKEENDQRLLLVKNPWSEGESWKGSTKDFGDAWKPMLNNEALPHWQSSEQSEGSSNDSSSSRSERHLTPGKFWIDLNKVTQHFESIYLNWNPGLFQYRQDIHFAWDLSSASKRGSAGCYVNHPQLSVTTKESGVLWLVLSRHFKNTAADGSGQGSSGLPTMDLDGHMSITVHDAKGKRLYTCDGPIERGPFVDSPQTLLRLDVEAGVAYTAVVAEQELSSTVHTFTLSAFAQSQLLLEEAVSVYPHSQTATSSWIPATAGGNGASPTYLRNPQFSIDISRTTPLVLLLETLMPDLNVHIKLLHSAGGKRITTSLKRRDIIGDSGDYRKQSCIAEIKSVEAGIYTIIASTFEPNQHAWFSLRADSNAAVALKLLPSENAGRLPVQLMPAQFSETKAKIACSLRPHRTARLYIEARYIRPPRPSDQAGASPSPSPLKITVVSGHRYDLRTIACSNAGEYADCIDSIRTNDVDLWPDMMNQGELWLVLERLVGGGEDLREQYALEMWFEGTAKPEDAVEAGPWVEWDRD